MRDVDYGLPHTASYPASGTRINIVPGHQTMTIFGSRIASGKVSVAALPGLRAHVWMSTPYTEAVPLGQRIWVQSHAWFTTLN